jgi:hypothetical protein
LTRRAKHRQNDIIETSWFTRAENIRRGFFRLDFEIGRRWRIAATHSSNLERRSARRRPNHCWPCTRERAGRGAGHLLAPLRSPGTEIGFAPETIVLRHAICRAFLFMEGQ